MNRNRLTLFDGIKSVDLPQYPDEAWTWLSGGPDGDVPGIQSYYKAIPFLFRGVDMRASRVSSMPFGIFRGESEIDSSADYQNVVGFLSNPKRLFALIEMSLTLLGKSYLFNVRNQVVTKDLKYLNPTTVKPKLEDPEGLVGWKRTTTKGSKDLAVEDIIYFWPSDPWVELGPPTASPGTASLMASGVLANVDEFVAAFFGRGAIKQTIWRAEGMSPADRKTFLAKWKRFSTGVVNAFRTIMFNAKAMEPIVVGEGIEGLQDQDLNNEKQKEIATALGIPQALLFSDAANFATAEADLFNFYDQTIVPETEYIFATLNEQVFEPMGLMIRDKHESLDVYQKDEKARSLSYLQYIQAKMPPSVAAEMLGLELPAGVEFAELDEFAIQISNAQAARFMPVPQVEPVEEVEAARSVKLKPQREIVFYDATPDLDKWERKALRCLKEGRTLDFEFESKYLSDTQKRTIKWRLHSATTPKEVMAAFNNITADHPDNIDDMSRVENITNITHLVTALRDASKALRETA